MEKRIIALILFLPLMLGRYAYADYTEEIVFRDIPWGTRLQSILYKSEFSNSYTYATALPFEEDFTVSDLYRNNSFYYHANGYKTSAYSYNVKVAGYPVNEINLYTLFEADNGTLIKDEATSRLYAAEYVFSVLDCEAAYSVLFERLTDLYGEGKREDEPTYMVGGGAGRVDLMQSNTIWKGANDSCVLLGGCWFVDKNQISPDANMVAFNMADYVYLVYYQSGHDDELRMYSKMEEQIQIELEAQGAEGYDGL